MRTQLLILATGLGVLASVAWAKPDFPPGAEALDHQIMAHIGPQTRAWISGEARRVAAKPSINVAGDVRQANLGDLSGGDIEELCFVVLMEATNDQDQDLELIMAETKAQTNAKQGHRGVLTRGDEGIATNSAVGGRLDSQSELGETASLRLQMAMDRRSKLMETLSNLLKSISSTNQAILQNLK
jgi:hypothetical protein